MINGLHSYKLLFMLQLIVGEGLFLLRLERKRRFYFRLAGSDAGLLSSPSRRKTRGMYLFCSCPCSA